ncbi:cysteine-tryptophan domain-containing zinc finger protein 7-like [Cornus florida]|uniref:cysteine-tryptophan domain-containing zinc finger protein 7-like n=1 Tax=Cornus florida TaxID=4283 RepID=UPI00289F53A6|nr:cysteine-tryptophan domain-containing zinc finger protein 7-like [Cornus florida]
MVGFGGEMEETELEEGEAYKDDTRIDPDVALSYIDEKLQSVLGHFQKDFEGGVSAENLGAKFGGYGSFLPTYQRSQPKSPHRVQNHSIPRSPNNLPVEGAPQNSTALSDAPLSKRLDTATHSLQSLHTARVASGDVSAIQVPCLSSGQVADKLCMKFEPSSNKSIYPTNQRTLKVRIKVGSDNKVPKNAAIYSGLGLISPSSSTGNSQEESGGIILESQEQSESPTSILQIMTSSPVPGSLLLSPLHDSVLCLIRKDKLPQNSKPVPALKSSQELSTVLVNGVNGSPFMTRDGRVSKEKKAKLAKKKEILVELKPGNGIVFEDNMTAVVKNNTENETVENEQCFSSDMKLQPLSNSTCDVGDMVKGGFTAAEASWEAEKGVLVKESKADKDGMEDGLSYTDSGKEESLESISGQHGKYEKQEARGNWVEKTGDHRMRSSHRNVSIDDDRSKSSKIYSPFKAGSDVSRCKEDPNVWTMNHLKAKVVQKSTSHEQDERMPRGRKSAFEGNRKSKGSQSNAKVASDLAEQSLMVGVSVVSSDKKKASKMHNLNLKSQKDIYKAHDKHRDVLEDTRREQMGNQMDRFQRCTGESGKDSEGGAVDKELRASSEKLKGRSSYKKADNQLTSETFLKEDGNDYPPTSGGLASELEPTLAPSVVIQENWVCCDRCQTWRLLPFGTKPEQLPEKWLCSMLNWLPGMNRCDISEEETTRALNALYQLPLPGSHNGLQNHADKIVTGGNSAEVQHFDHNHKNPNSHAVPKRGKKKQVSKETPNMASNGGQIQLSNLKKNPQQEAVKSRSINDMNNSSVQHLSKSCNFAVEKNNIKQKEKHENGADVTRKKPKSKREAEQYAYGARKKIKTEGAVDTNKYWNSKHDEYLVKADFSSSVELPNKVAGTSMQKHNGDYYSKDAKCDTKNILQISVNKPGDSVQISRDTGSLDMKSFNGREMSLKKRKLDWHDSQKYLETLQSSGKHLPDIKFSAKEEPVDGEFRKEKKYRVSRTEEESSTSKDDDRSTRKGRITRILLSGSRDNAVHGMEEIRSMERDQQPGKHRSKVASRPTLDDVDSLKRDLGSEQFSTAATSSSSKVSDSRKNRANFREANGSPAESVSSSPSRTSNLDKLSPARGDIVGTNDVRTDDFPMVANSIKSMSGEDNVESNKPQTARKKKVSGVFHPELLGFPALDFRDNNVSHKFIGKSKFSVKPPEVENIHLVNTDADTLEQKISCPRNLHTSDHFNNTLFPRSVNGSSLQTEEKDISSGSNFGRVKVKVSDPSYVQEGLSSKQKLQGEAVIGPHHRASYPEERSDMKCSIKSIKDDNSFGKKGSGKWAYDSKSKNQLKFRENDGSDVKLGALSRAGGSVSSQQNLIQDFEGEITKKNNLIQVESRGGKSQVFPRHAGKQETMARVQPVSGLQNKIEFDVLSVDASGNGDVSKVSKQAGKPVNQKSLGNLVSNRWEVRDVNASSPQRWNASGHTASNALKEAEDLREYADQLKISGFDFECNEAYFQAALKFLHCALLLETCNSDNYKHGEMSPMQIYNSTAKLCEICAHEYEKRQEMAAAALAYKCMEVAYMKVVYCKHSSTSRDRHELQASLQVVPQGESPSSSASDVDNLNNQAMVDKAGLSKGIGSHAGNHFISARNRPNFVRLLDFTKDVNSAMEASRNSQNAFAAANVILEDGQNKEGIVSVKRVIDFGFQDVEELIRLVKLATGAISRQGFSGSKN